MAALRPSLALLLGILLVLVLLLELASPASAERAGVSSGIKAGAPISYGLAELDPTSPAEAAVMAAGKVRSVRVPIDWADVQAGGRGSFDFSAYDPSIEALHAAGIEPLLVLAGRPAWIWGRGVGRRPRDQNGIETSDARVPPWRKARPAFGEFVRQTVLHFQGKGADYEIWNEPTNSLFTFASLPQEIKAKTYAPLLIRAARVIRELDPEASVVLAGLSPNHYWDFLRHLSDNQRAMRSFDAYSTHPYGDDIAEMIENVRKISLEIRQYDQQRPIWITEIGVGVQVGETPGEKLLRDGEAQAQFLKTAFSLVANRADDYGIERLYWYTMNDCQGRSTETDPEAVAWQCRSGLFEDGQAARPRPAWDAFRDFSLR